ncbi:MAG TPA: hypothetical protein VK832_09425, partial [Burkholderiaceae bacterium]|nr:hypothetical protein [Burkholderiaceae bacterium]
MRKSAILTMLLLVFFRPAVAADCESYTGTRADTTKEVATEIGKALSALKTRNTKGLFALSSHTLLLL